VWSYALGLIIQKTTTLRIRHNCVVDKAKLYRPRLKEDFAKRLNIVAELFQMLTTL